jgi:ferric-dicitrate binding protein FerR (iron transport regulator)
VKHELLQRYFANQVTPEEENLVITWIDDPANQAALLAYMEEGYEQEKETVPVAPFEVLFKEALHRESRTAKLVPMRARKWIVTGAAAACAICLIAGGWIGYHLRNDKAEVRHTWVLNEAPENAKQQHTRVLLSDGSEVYLNADSKLTIEKEMNISPVVYLEGAASFNLRKEGNGVTIKTKGLVTKAKDSRLNISAFPKDSTVTVSVQKGLAEVISNDRVYPLMKLRIPKQDSAQLAKAAEEMRMKKAFMPLTPLRPVVIKANESVTFDKNNKENGEHAKGASDSIE